MTTRRLKIAALLCAGLGVLAGVGVVLAARLAPLPPAFAAHAAAKTGGAVLERPASQLVMDKDGGWLRVYATPDGGRMWRIPVFRDELPETLVRAVLTFEDQRFYQHFGVDPLAIVRAAYLNVRKGRVVSGGSTITMQVARMLERRPRTLSSKLIEVFRALQLELRFDKDELLTAYFNLAPYGGNIEGVGAASYFYYEKDVTRLSLDEAATLAALPNAPSRLRPDRGKDKLRARRDDVLERMLAANAVSREAAETALSMPIHARRRRAPFATPHLANYVRRLRPAAKRMRTTIDPTLQRRVEHLLGEHIDRLGRQDIENGAVVVIENATRAVRAYAGSRDFFRAGIDGQVDGARAHRSPGSTLKPFVYAMGLDRGAIGLNTLLADVPIQFADWAPENFDGKYRGLVSAQDALAQSLNVPAVRVAALLGKNGLNDLFAGAGISTFTGKVDYGLAAVLGGCEMTLLELTNLYASLSQLGLHAPVRLFEDEPNLPGQRLFSAGAAYLVGEILTDVQRPELPEVWRDAVSMGRLAWKTGTSYGRRDAWSVGYNRRYTVGVWVGNFDGRGVPELVGSRAAAPLLFSIAATLPGATSDPWLARPSSVAERAICPLSGRPASASCPHEKAELALTDIAPNQACDLHVRVDVDNETGERLCTRCRHDRPHHTTVHVVWPAIAVPWLEQAGVSAHPVPPHNAACELGLTGVGPTIHTPHDGDEYVLREGIPPAHQQIALAASGEGAAQKIFWFVDGKLLARAEPGETVMLDPRPGRHELAAVDEEGRRSAVQIRIRE